MIENSEKELLKKDLESQENPEEIKKFIEDVELMGENEDIVEMAKQKLEAILAKVKSIETTNESHASQVKGMDGTEAEVAERTKEVDQKIEEVQTEAVKQIEEVKNIPEDESKEKSIDEIEREKQSAKDLDQLKKIKEHPDYNNLIQIATELRALHKVNKEKGSEEALQNYRRKEEDLNELVNKIAGDSGLSSYKILSASEILNIDEKLEVEGQKAEKNEKSKDEIEIKNVNTAIDSEIERVNKALSEIENESLPEDLDKYLKENKNRTQEVNLKISESEEKIKDYRENSPEAKAYRSSIEICTEKEKEIDKFLAEESDKIDLFDDKKILNIAKRIYGVRIEDLKKEYKDDPDRLSQEIKELQSLQEMNPDKLKAEIKEGLRDVLITNYGGGSRYLLKNENERLNDHKNQIKLFTIMTDNEKLIGKSNFEKDLEKKVDELNSANHDYLEKNISFDNSYLMELNNSKSELLKKRQIISGDSKSRIDDYIRLKEREMNNNADGLSIDKLGKDNPILSKFLRDNEYSQRDEDYEDKKEKLGLGKLYESSRQKSIKLDSIKEKIKGDYI